MKTGKNVIVAQGVIYTYRQIGGLLGSLRDSELLKHLAKPVEISFVEGGFLVTLHVKKHADFLIKSSLKDGLLRAWNQEIKIQEPAEV